VWLMQPEAQTTTRGILAVSAGALEVLLQYIRHFRSCCTLTICFVFMCVQFCDNKWVFSQDFELSNACRMTAQIGQTVPGEGTTHRKLETYRTWMKSPRVADRRLCHEWIDEHGVSRGHVVRCRAGVDVEHKEADIKCNSCMHWKP